MFKREFIFCNIQFLFYYRVQSRYNFIYIFFSIYKARIIFKTSKFYNINKKFKTFNFFLSFFFIFFLKVLRRLDICISIYFYINIVTCFERCDIRFRSLPRFLLHNSKKKEASYKAQLARLYCIKLFYIMNQF